MCSSDAINVQHGAVDSVSFTHMHVCILRRHEGKFSKGRAHGAGVYVHLPLFVNNGVGVNTRFFRSLLKR